MKKIALLIIALLTITSMVNGQDSEPDYLCFEVTAGTKISLTTAGVNCSFLNVNVEYSYNKTKWYSLSQSAITVSNDCNIYFRGKNTTFFDPNLGNINNPSLRAGFYVSKPFKCSGNIMTLIDKTGKATSLEQYAFQCLFLNCPILTAPKLPATSLSYRCYASMFRGCTRLVEPPELPATALGRLCYSLMFSGCTNLEKAPDLPATVLQPGCYSQMFEGCTKLKKAPKLKTFTTYAESAYYMMFQGCTSLEYISVGFNKWYTAGSTNSLITQYWVQNVAPSGTFVCPSGLEEKFDDDHIPTGWKIKHSEDLYSITISESSQPYITIAQTTEIDAGAEISFSVADRTSDGLIAIVNVQGTTPIETTQSGNDYVFTMPEEDVIISISYTPIKYSITTDAYSSAATEASAGETVNVTFTNRDGYNLTSATYNGNALTISDNAASFSMPAEAVTIATTYTPIDYDITSDQYATPSKNPANVGDVINVTFSQRDGYNLTSATYNDNPLIITNNSASFTMPAEAVTIATTYTPINYTITADQYATPSKNPANVGDVINVTFATRPSYNLTSATYNSNSLTITNNTASFTMPAEAVTIATTYTPINYTITADQYATPSKNPANVGDVINVTFAQRDGYNLTSATYNNNPLTITNNTASFTMPAANVTIATTYSPIVYNITTDQYITVDKSSVTINDQVTFTVADRSAEGLLLEKILVNDAVFNGRSFDMKDYLQDIEIKAVYSNNSYTITTDEYSNTDKASANTGDLINVTFANRDGYTLTSATYNGTALTINNGSASFTMPAANVTIATTYSPIVYNITSDQYITADKSTATINDQVTFTVADRSAEGLLLEKVLINNAVFSGRSFDMKDYLQDVDIKAVYMKDETQKPEEIEIITDNNVEIILPEDLEENSVIRFTVVQKEGYSAFVYVNGVLTEEYSFVYHKGTTVKINVDYKEFTVSDITAETYGHCAGDEYHLTFVTNDFARQFELTFADEALQNSFENLDYQDIIAYGNQTASFNIPQNANPGKYTAYIRVKDNQGNQSRAFEFEFEVFFPNDIIETKYSDLICVNNSSKEYIGYQWIKNNHLITGATKQFFVDAPLLNGAYAVIVTKQNGEKIRVCNFDVKDMKLAKSSAVGVKVYPNPAKSGEKIFVEISGLTITSDTYILIYNQIGGLVERIDNVSTLNTITLKQGVYNGIIINGNKKHTFRIIVND